MRSDLPAWAADAVHNDVEIHFGWQDRLKILFGWKVTLEVDTATQHVIGRTEAHTTIRVWRFRGRPQLGMVEVDNAR